MKLKLTPLNIVTAICLVMAGLLIFNKPKVGTGVVEHNVNGLWMAISFLAAFISFLSDQIFRKFIPLIRNLWVIEGAFIVFTLVFIFILKLSILN
jgi:hypothetical protein